MKHLGRALLAVSWFCAPGFAWPWANGTTPKVHNTTSTPSLSISETPVYLSLAEASPTDTKASSSSVSDTSFTFSGTSATTPVVSPSIFYSSTRTSSVDGSASSVESDASRKATPSSAKSDGSEGSSRIAAVGPNADGTCATHLVKMGDNCANIATKYGLKTSDIEELNKLKTWGFNSCDNLNYPLNICVSEGDAPMPAEDENAVCGPTKPGTKPPDKSKNETYGDLSPCPLKACCNIWGQCGVNGDFCKPTKGKYGNPGTGPASSNGCVQNCGQKIVNNDAGPSQPIHVGYYESWNFDRPCLKMRARALADTSLYTHIHWGFGTITKSLNIGVNDTHGQWADFKRLKSSGIKTVLSLGGWGDSTSPATYDILRSAVSPDGRERFTTNLAKFAKDNDLSGIDIDWEYPGAPDIPGIPAGQKEDGSNYLAMLKLLRSKLDSGMTLSIAAPASYWYLKPFPIDEMAKHLDYIVYMTYDLHGQWDFGNEWAQPGCKTGDCLRSHVNLTETYDALSMITKAGVPSNKIVVGVSSYGRSFKMTTPGCTGSMCRYSGSNTTSNAKPGECTGTGGYISNAEIAKIIKTNPGAQSWYDAETDSDYLVYDSTEWVAYMKDTTKASRSSRWLGLNFAGTIDWAVDLQEFGDDDGCTSQTCGGNDGPGGSEVLFVGPEIFTDNKPIECNAPCQLILPPYILPKPTTITFPPMTTSLAVAWTETTTVTKDGTTSTSKFISRVVQTTTLTIPPVTTTAIEFWNDYLESEKNETLIWLTWSILPPPFTITNDRNPENKTGVTHPIVTRTIFPPPWPYKFETPTTTPTPTTHGSSTLHSSVHVTKATGNSKPRCTRNCGSKCKFFCDMPCLPGFCPPGGGGGRNDFNDPKDPNPPPPPPGPGPGPGPGGSNPCEAKPDTGRCPNGNFPVWDPASARVRCDVPDDKVEDTKSQCQKELDKDLEKAKEDLDQSKSCCPAARSGDVFTTAATCPVNPNYPTRPTQPGGYHTVFTCDFALWPNVCANARSAILRRGKTDLLTYSYANGARQNHETGPWSAGKHWGTQNSGEGWALRGCEIEEYPFASGDPNRSPNNKLWNEQRVLRLVPAAENYDHGQRLGTFVRAAGNGHFDLAHGLIYKVDFANHPAGTTDADFFLGADTSRNVCAQPYGNAYILVNKAAVDPGQRQWDPWWDSRLIRKTTNYKRDSKGTATAVEVANLPSMYCQYPSPGNLIWNGNGWSPEGGSPKRLDRKNGKRYWLCDNYPGYSGPDAIPPLAPGVRRKRAPTMDSGIEPNDVDVTIGYDRNPVHSNTTISIREAEGHVEDNVEGKGFAESNAETKDAKPFCVDDVVDDRQNETVITQEHKQQQRVDQEQQLQQEQVKRALDQAPSLLSPQPRFAHALVSRATGGGSFLDSGAFNFLCGASDAGEPPCPNGCKFPSDGDDDNVSDGGNWGDNNAPGSGGGNNGGDGGDDDDDEPSEPSKFDYGLQWGANECKQKDVLEVGTKEQSCSLVPSSGVGFVTNSVRGFAQNGYMACFYNTGDCKAKNSGEFASLKGGDRLSDKNQCVQIANGKQMFTYEVVKGSQCHGDPDYLASPDPSKNEKHCYDSGQKSNRGAIIAAAQSFCRDVKADTVQGPVWSNYKLEGKKQPSAGFHFKLVFQVYAGCVWTANYDECLRYMKVPIDSCNCGGENGKQGGWVENNCIMAKIDPNDGV